MNSKVKKILFCIILFLGLMIIKNNVYATTINISPSNPKVGDTVKITVSVPNVNTADITANVSGVVSGTIRIVDGAMSGAAQTFTGSAEYKCTTAGTINVNISSGSTAVLNGEYVNVGASASTNVSAATTTTTTSDNTQTSTNASSTTTENKKSSNANLSNLGIRPNDFSGFRAATTSYNVTIPKDVEEVELYATAQDSKATISGTGKKKLEVGKNTLSVTVKAEDGTTKTYTVNVIRDESEATEEEQEEEETQDPEEVSKGLAQLKFDGLELKPEFKTDIYEYEVDYNGEDSKLDITAIATDVDYEVEITGNEDLEDGENYITILVSDKEGNNVATYQIKVNKTAEDDEIIEIEGINRKQIFIIAGIVLGILLFIIIVIVIVKRIRNEEDYEEWEDDEDEEFEYKGNNQLEDFDDDMKYINEQDDVEYEENETTEDDGDDDFVIEEPEEKVEYGEDNEELEEEKTKRKHKGKRFK